MNIIKTILGTLFAVYAALLFVATMLIVLIPIWVISLLPEPARAKALHWAYIVWMGFYLPLIFCPVFRKGRKNFVKGEHYVVVINHNSLMDIPVSTPCIPGPNKTLAKIEMSRIPLFGIIYKAGSILLDRKNEQSRLKSLSKMQETLEMGIHLCLYPEGTRNRSAKPLQAFQDGAFLTAIRAQRPIAPALIFNTGKILPHNRKFWLRPMPIAIHFLPAIPTTGLTIKELPNLKEHVHEVMSTYYIAHKDNPLFGDIGI